VVATATLAPQADELATSTHRYVPGARPPRGRDGMFAVERARATAQPSSR
jgi:hypothetical protein